MVQQPGLWQRLYHYPEDQGAGLFLSSHYLWPSILRKFSAGDAPGTKN